jgi:hypothetical protein
MMMLLSTVLMMATSVPILPVAERAAIFKAAGAKLIRGRWVICAEEPRQEGATIDEVRDLNGDDRPEAVVSEGGTFCHGAAETGFSLLSKQGDGSWRLITSDNGFPQFLPTKGVGGWPDISIGGPGFCFPVQRWNGKAYVVNRFAYEGKPCRPGR